MLGSSAKTRSRRFGFGAFQTLRLIFAELAAVVAFAAADALFAPEDFRLSG